MNELMNKLLAEIQELSDALIDGELTPKDGVRLQMIRNVLRQIQAYGVPDYPIVRYVEMWVD
jgi:hypothetical protein